MTGLKYLKDVVTLDLDVNKCTACGMCAEVCPHGVFSIEDSKARIVDRDACMECGACAGNCPVDAIEVRSGGGCAASVRRGATCGTDSACDCSDTGGGSCCN